MITKHWACHTLKSWNFAICNEKSMHSRRGNNIDKLCKYTFLHQRDHCISFGIVILISNQLSQRNPNNSIKALQDDWGYQNTNYFEELCTLEKRHQPIGSQQNGEQGTPNQHLPEVAELNFAVEPVHVRRLCCPANLYFWCLIVTPPKHMCLPAAQ